MTKTFVTRLLLLAVVFASSAPAAQSAALTAKDSNVVILKVSDLRSAFMIRAGLVRYDANASSPVGLRTQLQRHFNVVIALLQLNTPHSIEIALARLEASDDHTWSDTQRANWRQRLLAMRFVQLRRLAAYRDRGQFPVNEGQADHPVPIFVDLHDTACAVGQLMRWSGWDREVSEIEHGNNLVYVPDALDSAVAEWVLGSGLTIEEAALIQPGYNYPAEHILTDYGIGAPPLDEDGLRFSNFEMAAHNYTVNADTINFVCAFSPGGCTIGLFTALGLMTPASDGPLPDPAKVGFLIRTGNPPHPAAYSIAGDRWIGIGGTELNYLPGNERGIQGSAALNRAQHIVISFDVSTAIPGTTITLLGQHSNDHRGGFSPVGAYPPVPTNGPTVYFLTTSIYGDNGLIASTTINRTTPRDVSAPWVQSTTMTFAPLTNARIQTDIWLLNGVDIEGFTLDFSLMPVPEPTSLMLVSMLGVFGIRRRRARADWW